jgi:NAD/NADP transhydrogenase alpha subunit
MAVRSNRTNEVTLHSRPAGLKAQIYRAATSRPAKIAYVAVGAVGLAALAVAIFGPRRFQRQIVRPVREAVSDQAERLWSESRPLRDQLRDMIAHASTESGREKLIRSFQSWIGHLGIR